MPRAKAAPKRKVVDEPAGSIDTEVLLAKVQAGVEKFEKDDWQMAIETSEQVTFPATEPVGLTRVEISEADLAVLRDLHRIICHRAHATGWGGVADTSGRERGYGYFVGCDISEKHFASGQSMLEYTGDELVRDRDANRRASSLLSPADLPTSLDAVIERLAASLRLLLPTRYAAVLRKDCLVAAQTNLHNGNAFLKPHLDEPLHDGFGGEALAHA